MMYLVRGLGYGLVAVGFLASFAGGLIVLVSFLAFLTWVIDLITPDKTDDGEEENQNEDE